jgi:hypothetical protein
MADGEAMAMAGGRDAISMVGIVRYMVTDNWLR